MTKRLRATLHGIWWKQAMRKVKFCVSCGDPLVRKYIREEERWRRACGDCGAIHYFNPRVVAGAIPARNGKVILGRRAIEPAEGYWTFPSGYVELGESAPEAAIRETWEEVKTRVRIQSLLGVYSYADAGVVTIVYIGSVPSSEKPKPTHETLEIGLFSPREIPWKELAFRSTKDALRDWKKTA